MMSTRISSNRASSVSRRASFSSCLTTLNSLSILLGFLGIRLYPTCGCEASTESWYWCSLTVATGCGEQNTASLPMARLFLRFVGLFQCQVSQGRDTASEA
jgi:hypothetical protein